MDGTLLDPDGELRPRVRDAVRRTLDSGVLVTLATGRRFDTASAVANELGLELPLVLHGGTIIQDSATGEVLYEDSMSRELLREVIDEILCYGQQPVLYTSPVVGDVLLSGPPEYDSAATARYLGAKTAVRRLPHAELPFAEHVVSVAALHDDDVLRPLYEALNARPTCAALLWEPDPVYKYDIDYLIDIVNPDCSKSKALAHLAARYGITLDEVMAIGDQVNDLQLIERVGLGVAMGNAIPAVQERAKVVVGTNAEDGVAEALHRFVLNGDDARG
ncbi:MAG: Cof-type HAD-IIB family hydrolase [Chloroflexota bacterium]|nr:Cof-type HAD-IIB family hydrolase [Chloroflexota bacterium]